MTSAAQQSLIFQSESGYQPIPADSGSGSLGRPFAKSAPDGRVATLETLYDYFINNVTDPDQALAQDPDFLQKIHNQPDVVASMAKRELTVASLPWDVDSSPDAQDKELAAKIARYVRWTFDQIPRIRQLFQQMQRAVLTGGVGHEFIWHREADGVERPIAYWAVDKSRFLFDRLGNMALRTRETPVWGSYVGFNSQPELQLRRFPLGKFTYHTYLREPGTWQQPDLEGYQYYGKGLDVALYIPVTFDQFALRFRMKWLERYGIPPTILYHPDNAPGRLSEIRRIADSLRGESIITIPKGMGNKDNGDGKNQFYSVEQMEAPKASYDAFQVFQQEYIKQKVESIILLSAEGNGASGDSGGYSDHVSKKESGPEILFRWDAQNISDTINTQLIPAIVERGPFKNVPAVYYPKFRMEPKEEKDQGQQLDIAQKAAAPVPVCEDEIYERAGLRVPKDGEKTVFNGQAQGPGDDPFDAMPGQAPPGAPPGAKPPGLPSPNNPAAGGKPRAPIGQGQDAGKGSIAKSGER